MSSKRGTRPVEEESNKRLKSATYDVPPSGLAPLTEKERRIVAVLDPTVP
jgi:hypothetical protein